MAGCVGTQPYIPRPPPQAGPLRQARVGSPPVILIVAGVAGSGKTTVGKLIAGRLGWEFADGDDFHSDANIAKMRSGQPLSDAERFPWLADIGGWMDAEIAAGEGGGIGGSGAPPRARGGRA